MTHRLWLAAVTVTIVASGLSRAHSSESSVISPRVSWELSGDLGALGEVYRIDGRPNRRPNETGRIFLRPTLSLAERYTIRSEFLLSTQGNSALTRHSLNQYMVNPSWRWRDTEYSARIGDFSDAYTATTFSGVQVRGGELAVRGKHYHATVLGGRTSPATAGGLDGGSFRQTMMASRVGYDSDARSAAVFFLYAQDDEGSLEALPDTANAIDSTEVGTAINPYAVTPQENLVVAVWGNANLLSNRLSLSGELGRSNYTRDRRAAELGSGRADYAFNSMARYHRDRFDVMGGYKRIGPGYVSLGVSSLHADQQEIVTGGAYRFGRRAALSTQISRQNDNLADQKEATTTRYRYVTTMSLRPTSKWTASFTGNYVTMANDVSNDSTRVDFSAWILGTNHAFSFGRGKTVQSASLSYTLQKSGDDNPLRGSSDAESHTVNASAMVRVTESVTASPLLAVTNSHLGEQGWRRTDTYGLAFRHRAMRNKLTNTLSTSVSVADGEYSYRNTLGSRYSITTMDSVHMRIATNNFRGSRNPTTSGSTYDEYTAVIGWSHRF